MKLEKKLIVCGILAIAVGIVTIMPLAFLMSPAKAQTSTEDMPWFNLKIPYALYSGSSQTGVDGYLVGIGVIHDLIHYKTSYEIGLSWTLNRNAVNKLADARIEYYQLLIYSDQGPIENITTAIGFNSTNYTEPNSFNFERKGWFNTIVSSSANFDFSGNLNSYFNPETNTQISGSYESNSFANTTLPLGFLNVKNAHTVFLDVYRLGYVTFSNNSTVVTLASDQVVQHIELTKSGDQFIYGTVPQIPQEQPIPSSSQVKP